MAQPLAIAIRYDDPVSPYHFAIAFKIEEAQYPAHKNWHIVQGVSESHENTMTEAEAAGWVKLGEVPAALSVDPASADVPLGS